MTKTYYQRDTQTYPNLSAYGYDLALTTATAGTVTESIPANATNQDYFQYLTNTGEPGFATWPTGDYVAQVNVVATGADITFRFQFARMTSTGAYGGWNAYSTGTLSGTGLKAGTATATPSGSTSTDRYQVSVVVSNANTMKAQDQSHEVNTANSYCSGPWTAATTGSLPPIPPRFHLIRR